MEEQAKKMAPHQFWDTQPVPNFRDEEGKEIEDGQFVQPSLEDIPKEPYTLMSGFEWSNVDINDDDQAKELFTLL